MSSAFDWLKELVGIGPKSPRPAAQTKPGAARQDRVRVQRPIRSNSGAQRIETITMTSYNDAMAIAEVLRSNVTAIINVSNLSSTDRARLIDFMAGLKAGLLANSSRVAEDVYLLAPEHVDIDSELNEDESDDDDGDRLVIRP